MLRAVAGGAVTSGGTGVAGVSSFNLRTGAVTLFSSDISNAGGALLLSPVFTGDPQAPTAALGDHDNSLATTAFVQNAINAMPAGGVTSFNTRTGAVTFTSTDISSVGGALLASPVFTGDPQAPTAAPGDSDNSIASTAFVQAAITAATSTITVGAVVADTPPGSPAQGALWWNSAEGELYISYHDVNSNQWVEANSGGLNDAPNDGTLYARQSQTWAAAVAPSALAAYAPLASPTFTGDPKAPTAVAGDNDTSVATTAFVQAAVAPAFNDIGRNFVHNPYFNVAQRGVGPFSTVGYTVDRWRIELNTDTMAMSQTTISDTVRASIGDEVANFVASFSVTGNAAAGAYSGFRQPIEDIRRLSGKTVTVSFWAGANSGTPKVGVSLDQYFGTGGSPSAAVIPNGQSVTIGTTWARYSLTFAIPSAAGKTLGTNADHCTNLWFWFSSGATNNARAGGIGVQTCAPNLWGVQLEIGSIATPLERRDPEEQFTQCQRFYTLYTGIIVSGYAGAGTLVFLDMAYPTAMRAPPTATFANISSSNASGIALNGATSSHVKLQSTITASGSGYQVADVMLSADL